MTQPQPQGYLALPTRGSGPAVLVLHAWWGLNDTIKSVCDRLAQEGFVAFAPDLFHGKVAVTREEAQALSSGAEADGGKGVRAAAAAAAKFLAGHPGARGPGLGIVGFSFGVDYALMLAADAPDRVRAVVIFYGMGPGDHARSKAAYLGHFAETDEFVPEAVVEELETALRAAGRPVTFHQYKGTGHWFFEPDRPDAYQRRAAELAWGRTIAFLRGTLRGRP
ncbi:MAG TPA: dienelactone hydrolase family protein [Gemmatimonadales bacterium]|nr:dienelactone hydrolase family protein [Gemmatimonadales bacterium]